mgnify:CR=1 FL=1
MCLRRSERFQQEISLPNREMEPEEGEDNRALKISDTADTIQPFLREQKQIVQPFHGFFHLPKIVQRAEQIDNGGIDLPDELGVCKQQRDRNSSMKCQHSSEQECQNAGNIGDGHDQRK